MIDLNRFDENNIVKTIQIDSDGFCKEFPGSGTNDNGNETPVTPVTPVTSETEKPFVTMLEFFEDENEELSIRPEILVRADVSSDISTIIANDEPSLYANIGVKPLNTVSATDIPETVAFDSKSETDNFDNLIGIIDADIDLTVQNDSKIPLICINNIFYNACCAFDGEEAAYSIKLLQLNQYLEAEREESIRIVDSSTENTETYHYEFDLVITLVHETETENNYEIFSDVLHVVTPAFTENHETSL